VERFKAAHMCGCCGILATCNFKYSFNRPALLFMDGNIVYNGQIFRFPGIICVCGLKEECIKNSGVWYMPVCFCYSLGVAWHRCWIDPQLKSRRIFSLDACNWLCVDALDICCWFIANKQLTSISVKNAPRYFQSMQLSIICMHQYPLSSPASRAPRVL
jgi:hypothetical protein